MALAAAVFAAASFAFAGCGDGETGAGPPFGTGGSGPVGEQGSGGSGPAGTGGTTGTGGTGGGSAGEGGTGGTGGGGPAGEGGTAGAAGEAGSAGTGGSPPPPPPPPPPLRPAPAGLRRLLSRQYVATVRALMGNVAAQAAAPPPDVQLHNFDAIAARELALPATAVAQYEASAEAIALAVVGDPATYTTVVGCDAATPKCLATFVSRFGRLAWRRPLADDEVARVVAAGRASAQAYGVPERGIAGALSALLQSPYFLYLIELGEPDPGDPSRRVLGPYELASRISFFLTNEPPDDAMLSAAAAGSLSDAAGVRAAAAALLDRPAARAALAEQYAELLRLRELEGLQKDPVLFPAFNAELRAAMREETLMVIDDIVWQRDADARELVDADFTYVNAPLAALYGLPPPAGGGFERVPLPEGQGRAGLLGQASFLSRFAHPAMTSPTRRGAFVQSALLCYDVPPPPPGVVTVLPDDGTPKTMKEKLEMHQQVELCASCHRKMDPIGFALENFDAIGQYRTLDQGLPIDPTAEMAGIGAFASAADLAALLRDDPRVAECMVRNFYRHGLGALDGYYQSGAIGDLAATFAASGYRLRSLLADLSASDAFRFVSAPTE
ncbi:MAG TPA: DUF1592 domain-containing protein [Polyangiaceae bacterium]|nr:DUF1592 domain-containing protein [Polyangiaceae bacterium]